MPQSTVDPPLSDREISSLQDIADTIGASWQRVRRAIDNAERAARLTPLPRLAGHRAVTRTRLPEVLAVLREAGIVE